MEKAKFSVWNLLSRETSGGRLVPQIDGLRFFAVMFVILLHIRADLTANRTAQFIAGGENGPLVGLVDHWRIGVQFFFAISGFVLALPFANERILGGKCVDLKLYYLRRVTRLEPPYIINLIVYSALHVLIKGAAIAWVVPHFFASLLYVHNIVYGKNSDINEVAWSLEIEVQFYLLAPFLARAFFSIADATWRRVALIGAIAASLTWQRFLDGDIAHGLNLLHHLHYFLVGFLLADLHLTDWNKPLRAKGLWDCAATLGFVGIIASLPYKYEYPLAIHWVVTGCLVVWYMGCFRGRIWVWIVSQRPIFTIGGMCYTIYLWHNLVVSATRPVTTRLTTMSGLREFVWVYLLNVAMLVPTILVVSAILFVLFEKPFMKRGWVADFKRRFGRAPATP